MQPEERDAGYLWDILSCCKLIQSFIEGMDFADFKTDAKTQSAVIRQQEIIGEATKQLSSAFREQHPNIPWQAIAGMRDVLIHAYKKVKVDMVWNTATTSVPELAQYITPLIPTPPRDD